ncbi:MAG: response regulator [Nitriliruptor sp.]|nr:MAG: response regulator [Nitriliruptor sp.]
MADRHRGDERGRAAVQRRVRVLHVDDDPEVLLLVQLIFDGEPDLELVSCSSADEARFAATSVTPDLFLIDVMMPGTDGPTLLEELRSRREFVHVPALFVTAKAHPSDLEALARTSAAGVVRKPFEAPTLMSQVRASLVARVG